MEEKENLFKCPNDLNVTITKDNGEVIFNENCCTNVSILVKNDGQIATSFLGAHSPEMVKVLDKTLKKYFKALKKTLKEEYKRVDNEDIKVVQGKTTKNSKEIENALKKEVEIDFKYEFESLKDIEKTTKENSEITIKKNNTSKKTNSTSKNNNTNKVASKNPKNIQYKSSTKSSSLKSQSK